MNGVVVLVRSLKQRGLFCKRIGLTEDISVDDTYFNHIETQSTQEKINSLLTFFSNDTELTNYIYIESIIASFYEKIQYHQCIDQLFGICNNVQAFSLEESGDKYKFKESYTSNDAWSFKDIICYLMKDPNRGGYL